MARKSIGSLAVAALIAIPWLSAVSTDAMAARRGPAVGAYHGGVSHGAYAYRGHRYMRPGYGLGGAAAAGGTYSYYNRPACGYYPYPPCY